ncbi:IS1 family transposase [Candidatus Electronema sp. JM]|uniref:IS1 family transposase n=1 Tax=Candidatus Electronema sp. JM TaxID=3401571 RepID=UPI003AA7E761
MAHLSSLSSCALEIEIYADAKADEFWIYVGNKKNQRWTWHAVERKSGIILAWHNGRRTDERCCRLMDKLSVFPVICLLYRRLAELQEIHSIRETCCRKSKYLENRA